MSKVCKECGCVNENDNARFCNDCGARFEDAATPAIKLTEVTNNSSQMDSHTEIDEDIEDDFDAVPVTKHIDEIHQAVDEDNEDDYEAEPVINTVKQSAPLVYDEDEDTFEMPVAEETVDSEPKEKKRRVFERKETSASSKADDEVKDMVSSDPYYDDVLPEINNERTVFNKELALKVSVALAGMLFIMYMIIRTIA